MAAPRRGRHGPIAVTVLLRRAQESSLGKARRRGLSRHQLNRIAAREKQSGSAAQAALSESRPRP